MGNDVMFIQFYYDNYHGENDSMILNNGFQHVHDRCRETGDFLWVRHHEEEANMRAEMLPIRKGRACVSAYYYDHLMQAWYWAERYPEIDFIVGGPAVRYGRYSGEGLPRNLTLTGGLAEEVLFEQPEPSQSWDFEPPADLVQDKDEIRFTYNMDRRCYWGRCIFCDGYIKSEEKPLNNGIEKLKLPDVGMKKQVRLNVPSMPPAFFTETLPKLPRREDVVYDFFLRGTPDIVKRARAALARCAAGEGPSPKQLRWVIGIEWPSEKMLAYMRKGTRRKDLLSLLRLAGEYGIPVGMPFIFGWNNITPRDVAEATEFIEQVEKIPNLATSCVGFSLEVHPGTILARQFLEEELVPVRKKIFNNGECRIRLSREQEILNREFRRNFIESHLNTFLYDSKRGNVAV